MVRLFPEDKALMDFLGVSIQAADLFHPCPVIVKSHDNKDKGQRRYCGCIVSKNIGGIQYMPSSL